MAGGKHDKSLIEQFEVPAQQGSGKYLLSQLWGWKWWVWVWTRGKVLGVNDRAQGAEFCWQQ